MAPLIPGGELYLPDNSVNHLLFPAMTSMVRMITDDIIDVWIHSIDYLFKPECLSRLLARNLTISCKDSASPYFLGSDYREMY